MRVFRYSQDVPSHLSGYHVVDFFACEVISFLGRKPGTEEYYGIIVVKFNIKSMFLEFSGDHVLRNARDKIHV